MKNEERNEAYQKYATLEKIFPEMEEILIPSQNAETIPLNNPTDVASYLNTHTYIRFIQFYCDVNRGGRRYLQKREEFHGSDDDDRRHSPRKVYPSSLWPLIFYRILHRMELTTSSIGLASQQRNATSDNGTNPNPWNTNEARRASVVYYLLINGAMFDR